MKILKYYIDNIEPFYIRAEKLFERKFTGRNTPEDFRLCSNMRGFSYFTPVVNMSNSLQTISALRELLLVWLFLATGIILGVTKRYSATIIMMVVSPSIEKYNRQQWQRLTNLLFGQSQQAGLLKIQMPLGLHTTKVVHAYFILYPLLVAVTISEGNGQPAGLIVTIISMLMTHMDWGVPDRVIISSAFLCLRV